MWSGSSWDSSQASGGHDFASQFAMFASNLWGSAQEQAWPTDYGQQSGMQAKSFWDSTETPAGPSGYPSQAEMQAGMQRQSFWDSTATPAGPSNSAPQAAAPQTAAPSAPSFTMQATATPKKIRTGEIKGSPQTWGESFYALYEVCTKQQENEDPYLFIWLHGADGTAELENNVMAVMQRRLRRRCFFLVPRSPKISADGYRFQWGVRCTRAENRNDWGYIFGEMHGPYLSALCKLFLDISKEVNAVAHILSGYSMGGFGCWQLAGIMPVIFTAVVPVAGHVLGTLEHGGMYKAPQPEAERRYSLFVNQYAPKWAQVPAIIAIHAVSDTNSCFRDTQELVNIIDGEGGNTTLVSLDESAANSDGCNKKKARTGHNYFNHVFISGTGESVLYAKLRASLEKAIAEGHDPRGGNKLQIEIPEAITGNTEAKHRSEEKRKPSPDNRKQNSSTKKGFSSPPRDVTMKKGFSSPPRDVTKKKGFSSPPRDVTKKKGFSSPPRDATMKKGFSSPPRNMTLKKGFTSPPREVTSKEVGATVHSEETRGASLGVASQEEVTIETETTTPLEVVPEASEKVDSVAEVRKEPEIATQVCSCGVPFEADLLFCTECGAKRPTPEPPAESVEAVAEDPPIVKSTGPWTCPSCDETNKEFRQKCNGCGAPKASGIASQDASAVVDIDDDVAQTSQEQTRTRDARSGSRSKKKEKEGRGREGRQKKGKGGEKKEKKEKSKTTKRARKENEPESIGSSSASSGSSSSSSESRHSLPCQGFVTRKARRTFEVEEVL